MFLFSFSFACVVCSAMVVTLKVCGILVLYCLLNGGHGATLRDGLGEKPLSFDKDGRYHFS